MPVSSHEDHIKHIHVHVDSIRPPKRETIYYTSIFGIMGVVIEIVEFHKCIGLYSKAKLPL